jgi:DNA mismatch endonuclease (patch repair protein)
MKKQTKEHIRKRVEARRRNDTYVGLRGEKNGNFGKSAWNKGKTGLQSHTEETKKLMRELKLGKIPWNKGKKGVQKSTRKGKKVKPHTEETKQKMRNSHKRRFEELFASGKRGHKFSTIQTEDTKKKIRKARLQQTFPTKDSIPEKMMQIALEREGIIFQKHKAIIGQPDIFIEPNLCIFVDGDFWHANPDIWKADQIVYAGLQASEIWNRDNGITRSLSEQGYLVMRFWTSFIEKSENKWANHVIQKIKDYANSHQRISFQKESI